MPELYENNFSETSDVIESPALSLDSNGSEMEALQLMESNPPAPEQNGIIKNRKLIAPAMKNDLLVLENPALADQIYEARDMGFPESDIAGAIREQAATLMLKKTPAQIDEYFGRDEESKQLFNMATHRKDVNAIRTVYHIDPAEAEKMKTVADRMGLSLSDMRDPDFRKKIYEQHDFLEGLVGSTWDALVNGNQKESVRDDKAILDDQMMELMRGKDWDQLSEETKKQINDMMAKSETFDPQIQKLENTIPMNVVAKTLREFSSLWSQNLLGVWREMKNLPAYYGAAFAATSAMLRKSNLDRLYLTGNAYTDENLSSVIAGMMAVKPALGMMAARGSYERARLVEQSATYWQLMKNVKGINPAQASTIAYYVGHINAWVEIGNYGLMMQLFPGASAFSKAWKKMLEPYGGSVVKMMARPTIAGRLLGAASSYGLGLLTEWFEEVRQGTYRGIGEQVARAQTGAPRKPWTEVLRAGWEEGKEAFSPLAYGMAPGAIVNALLGIGPLLSGNVRRNINKVADQDISQQTETEKSRIVAAGKVLRDIRAEETTTLPQGDGVTREAIDFDAPANTETQIDKGKTAFLDSFGERAEIVDVDQEAAKKKDAKKGEKAEAQLVNEEAELPKVVYIDAEKLDTFLQSLPEEQRVTIREALGWSKIQKTEGEHPEYALPRTRFERAVEAHKDLADAIGRDSRLGIYGVTANELNIAKEKAREMARDPINSDEPWAKEAQGIREDLKFTLLEAGRSDEEAETVADYWSRVLYGLANILSKDENGQLRAITYSPQRLYETQTIGKWIGDSITDAQSEGITDKDVLSDMSKEEALQAVEDSQELPLYDDVGQTEEASSGMFTDIESEDGESYEQAQRRKKDQANILTKGNILSKGERPANLRTKPAPTKTGIGYKVFVLKNVNGVWGLYPAKIANAGNVSSALGVWIDAEAAPITGTSTKGRPFVAAGGAGADESSGRLAYRPGWHLGTIPYALQFNRGPKVENPLGAKNKNGDPIMVGEYFPNNFVWCEVEYADDVDYQEEAMAEGFLPTGGFNYAYAGLKRLPVDGSYRYRTNANPATDEWIISGAMKVKRVLTREEVDQIVEDAGRPTQLLEDGDILTQEIVDELNDRIAQNEAGGEDYFQSEVNEGTEVSDKKSEKRDQSAELNGEDRATWEEASQGLTEYEKNRLVYSSQPTSIRNFLKLYQDLPAMEEAVTVALAGRAKKGWYARSAIALQKVFGKDVPRFTALLAALSPQCSVETNLSNTLKVWMGWRKWTKANPDWGKLPYAEIRAAVIQIMKDNVQQADRIEEESSDEEAKKTKGQKDKITQQTYGPVLEAWVNNSVRALITTDQDNIRLSGPKVNSFMNNLRGDLTPVTNDTWMARFAGWLQKRFSGSLTFGGKAAEKAYAENPFVIPDSADSGYQAGYLAMNAYVRRAATQITENLKDTTGETWEPAEIQETVWSWIKTYVDEVRRLEELWEKEYNEVGKNDPDWIKSHPFPTVRELVADNKITDEKIGSTVDFAQLLVKGDDKTNYGEILRGDNEYAKRLEELSTELGDQSERVSGSEDDRGPADGVHDRDDASNGRRETLLKVANRLDRQRRGEILYSALKEIRKKYADVLVWRSDTRRSDTGSAAKARPYGRGTGRSTRLIRLVDGTELEVRATELTPQTDVTSTLERAGQVAPVFYELDMDDERSIPAFIEALKRGKESQGPVGLCVTLKTAKEYAGHKLYLAEGGLAGFAIAPDTDIVSAFSVKGAMPLVNGVEATLNRFGLKPGVAPAMLLLAVQEGGRRLDCFDTILPGLYSTMGFKAVSRCAFNWEFRPDGWTEETSQYFRKFNKGYPDVVFMIYDPEIKDPYQSFAGKMKEDYDTAKKSADDAIYESHLKAGDTKAAQLMVKKAAKEAGLPNGEEKAIILDDGRYEDGSTIDLANAIFDKKKKGLTDSNKKLEGQWFGIAKGDQVIGRVLLGEPQLLKKGTQEYKAALIKGTDRDLKDGEKRYYYPITKRIDMRDKPIPVKKKGKSVTYQLKSMDTVTYDKKGKAVALSERFNPKNASSFYQSAWHGSPHRFDSFDLVATHGIDVSALEKAFANFDGQLPMPSLAIGRRGQEGATHYGEITLIGDRNMVDPQQNAANEVYSTDMQTPIVPSEVAGDYTPENVLNAMLAAEAPELYGEDKVRIAGAKRLGSIEEMHAAEGRLASDEDFQRWRAEVGYPAYTRAAFELKQELRRSGQKLGPGAMEERVGDVLADYVSGKGTLESITGISDLSAETKAAAKKYKDVLAEAKTEYFEAKPRRLVDVDEFRAAAVPSSTPAALRQKLEERGVIVYEYPDGDQAARQQVVEQAAQEQEVYFQEQKRQSAPRGRVTFTEGGRSLIELFPTADASTFIHESGHVLFKFLLDFGRGKDAAPLVAKDLGVVLDFLGMTDFDFDHVETDEQKARLREAHEKFARTLELYLMEGKAPTSYLKQIFAKMKRWLLSIYHTATALNTEITPEIRDFFDRMLAGPDAVTQGGSVSLAEMQADSVATEARIEALEKQDTSEGEGDVPYLRVIAAQNRSTTLADSDIPKWVPPTLMGGIDKEDLSLRPALVAAVRKLGGIDYDSISAVWGEDEAKALRAREASLFKKNGRAFDTIIPDLQAEGIPVNDVHELYDRLMQEDPRIDKDLNVPITEETLPWLFYLLGDDEVRDYALKRQRALRTQMQQLQNSEDFESLRTQGPAVYQEQDLIREVLKALKRPRSEKAVSDASDAAYVGRNADMSFGPAQGEVTRESIPTQEAANRAAGLLRDDELISLREADRYAWRRAQRESRKAFLAGKKEATQLGRERITQLRNEWRERVAAREEKRKQRIADLKARQKERAALKKEIAKLVKRINAARKQKSIIWAARKEIEDLLSKYTLKNPSPERMAKAQFLFDYLMDHPDGPVRFEDYSPGDQEAIRMLGTTLLPDMTMDELRDLDAKVQEIRDRGRAEYERWKAEKQQRRDEMFSECFAALGDVPTTDDKVVRGPQDLRKQYKGVKGKLEKAGDWTYAATLGSHRLMDWIGNGKGLFKSAWTKWFIEKVNRAHDDYLRHANDRREQIESALRENGLTLHDLSESRVVDGQQYTVDEMLSVYALMKNEKGRKALLYGNFRGLADPQAHASHVIQSLTQEERNVADAVLQDYEDSFDRLNKRFIEVYNDAMIKEEKYSPMKRLEYTTNEGVMDAEDADAFAGRTAMQGAAAMVSSLEKGFLIKRMEISEEHQQPVDLGLLSIWNEQVTAQEHTAAFAQLAGDLTSVLYRRDEKTGTSMAKAIRLTKGDEAWHSVVGYTNLVIMNEARAAHNVLNNVGRVLGRNMTMVYLAGSLSSALKQVASIPRFVMSAGLGHVLRACGQYMADPKGFMAEAYRLDPQIKERLPNAFYRLTQIDPTTASKLGYRYNEAMRILMTPFSYMDRVAAAIGWRATYDRSIKDGLSPQKAYEAAQRAVALTQQVPNIKDMPAFWRQSGIAKLMMIFSSNNIPIWGMTAYDMAQAIKRGDVPESLKVMLALTISATAMALVTKGPPSGDDDDSWAEWLASAFTEQSIQSIPIVGKELVAAYDELINRNRRGSTYSALVTPIVKSYQGLQRMMADDSDKVMGSGLTKAETGVWQAMEGLSVLFGGLPVTMARRLRTALSAEDWEQAVQILLAMRRKQ